VGLLLALSVDCTSPPPVAVSALLPIIALSNGLIPIPMKDIIDVKKDHVHYA
jgi:hypothetical protein